MKPDSFLLKTAQRCITVACAPRSAHGVRRIGRVAALATMPAESDHQERPSQRRDHQARPPRAPISDAASNQHPMLQLERERLPHVRRVDDRVEVLSDAALVPSD